MDEQWWEYRAATYEWTVPWRDVHHQERWFIGGYGNPAINVVDRHLETRADQIAVVDRRREQQTTYRELYWHSARLARWWRDHGVCSGDRICIQGPATISSLVAWLAASRLGAVVVRSVTDCLAEFSQHIARSEARFVVSGDQLFVKAASSLPVLWIGDPSGRPNQGACWDFNEVQALDLEMLDPVSLEANVVGLLMYGDSEDPYAFSGIGSLIAWHQTFKAMTGLSPNMRVGIQTTTGGLADRLVLTWVILAEGARAIWLDADGPIPPERNTYEIGIGDNINGIEVDAEIPEVCIGPERGSLWQRTRAQTQRLYPNLSEGLYTRGRAVGVSQASPGGDLSRNRHLSKAKTSQAHNSGVILILERMRAIAKVREVACSSDLKGTPWLFVVTSQTRLELMAELGETASLIDGQEVCLVVTDNLPTTIEGRVQTEVLSALARRDTRIPLAGLINSGCVETLARSITELY